MGYSRVNGVKVTWLPIAAPEFEEIKALAAGLRAQGFSVRYAGPSSDGPCVLVQQPERRKLTEYLRTRDDYRHLALIDVGIL